MNKKIKIVSTVALTGLLTLNVLNPKTLAKKIDDTIETKPVGVYSKLVEGKTVVPFVLQTNNDKLTLKEMKVRFEISKVNIKDEDQVATGDTFISNGKEHTVIVYGDVNNNGEITPADALAVQDYYINGKGFDEVQKEAADINDHNGKIEMSDALRIQQFYIGEKNTTIDNLPKEEINETNYKVIINENGIVNNQNEKNSLIEVKLTKTLEKETNVKVIINCDDKNITKTMTIKAHTDYEDMKNVDLSGMPDGKYEVKLVDEKDEKKELAKSTIIKNTDRPIATNVKIVRDKTRGARLASLETGYDGDIKTVKYEVKTKTGEIRKTGEINITNNSVYDYQIIDEELIDGTEYNFTYWVINSYGSESNKETLVIAKDEKVPTNNKVEIKTNETSFAWDAKTNKKYIYTLYRNGNIVTTNSIKATKDEKIELRLSDIISNVEEGKYKISIYVEGDSENYASETVMSDEIEINKLKAITDLKLNNESGKISLTWSNANDKKILDTIKANYKITLYEINEKGDLVVSSKTITAPDIDANKVEDIKLEENVVYVAKASIIVSAGEKYISSDETASNEFYIVTKPTIKKYTASSSNVTLTSPDIKINGKKVTYKVEVVTIDSFNEKGEPEYGDSTVKDVNVKDNDIVVDGLKSDKLYSFRLIVAIDGNEIKSEMGDVIRTLPDLSKVQIVKEKDQVSETGKVYYDGKDVYILGNVGKKVEVKAIDVDKDYEGSKKLENQLNIIKALSVGDEATILDTEVSLKLNENGITTVDLGKVDMKDIVLNVTTNDFMKTLKINSDGVKQLNILAGLFDLSTGITAKEITLANGVDIKSSNRVYIINAGAKVKIDNVYVTAKERTEIIPNQSVDKLNLSVNVKDKITNDLVFENNLSKNVEINFVGGNKNGTDELLGKVTIKTNGGKVTVTSDKKVAVKAPLAVEVNKGNAIVDIKDEYISGEKTMSLNKSEDEKSTLTANVIAKTKAPVEIKKLNVDSTLDELSKIYDTYKDYKDNDKSKEKLQEIKAYLDSFELSGTEAEISVKSNDDSVEIVFNKAMVNRTIANIK